MKKFLTFVFTVVLLSSVWWLDSCKKKEDPAPSTPTTPTNPVTATAPTLDNAANATGSSEITATSAKVSSTLSANGGAAISQHGHVWSETNAAPTTADAKTELGAASGPFPLKFTSELKSLKANTTYNVRAYAVNDKGTTYGNAVQVKTTQEPIIAPSFAGLAPTNITSNSVKFSAVINAKPNRKVTRYGFIYSDRELTPTNASFTITKNAGTNLSDNTNFPLTYTLDVTGLQENTQYYVKAFIELETESEPTPKLATYEQNAAAFTFRTTGTNISFGTWKEITANFTKSSLRQYNFWYQGLFYEFSQYGGITTYSPSTNQLNLNGGEKFPGIGQIAEVVLTNSGKVITVMGKDGSVSKITKETWEYDLSQKKWTKKADFPGIPRTVFVMVQANNKVYVGGGTEYTVGRPGYATTLKDWWEYDPATDKWTQKADMLVAAYDLQGFETSINQAVVGLGQSNVANSWYNYNPFKNEWRKLTSPSGDFMSSGGVVWQERFSNLNYAVMKNAAGTKYFLWEYSALTEKWTQQTELPVETTFQTYLFPNNYNSKPSLIHYNSSNFGYKVFEFTKN